MSSEDKTDLIIRILDERNGRTAVASGNGQHAADPEIRALLEAADLAWSSEQIPPPLADDPVAAMLGLVPDPSTELDGRALATARKSARLTVSELSAKMAERGWDVTSKDIFSWERGRNLPHVPALINALAEETKAAAEKLRRVAGEDPERVRLTAIVRSPAFVNLAERWARVQGTTLALAASALESRLLVAVHRGGAPDSEVLLESLEAMVNSVEDSERR